jgi:hypothetical protein
MLIAGLAKRRAMELILELLSDGQDSSRGTNNIPTSMYARNIAPSDTQTLQTHTKCTHGLTSHQELRLRWHGPEEACHGPGAEGGAGMLIAGLAKRRATELTLEQLSDGQDSGRGTDNIPTSMYARNIAPSDTHAAMPYTDRL